jgi:hypothetical protein
VRRSWVQRSLPGAGAGTVGLLAMLQALGEMQHGEIARTGGAVLGCRAVAQAAGARTAGLRCIGVAVGAMGAMRR